MSGINKKDIEQKCDEIAEMLIKKNESYGDAVGQPIKILSNSNKKEQVNVRADDKLSRLKRGKNIGENDIKDLTGYLVLKLILDDKS